MEEYADWLMGLTEEEYYNYLASLAEAEEGWAHECLEIQTAIDWAYENLVTQKQFLTFRPTRSKFIILKRWEAPPKTTSKGVTL